jgi:hypothetical protein
MQWCTQMTICFTHFSRFCHILPACTIKHPNIKSQDFQTSQILSWFYTLVLVIAIIISCWLSTILKHCSLEHAFSQHRQIHISLYHQIDFEKIRESIQTYVFNLQKQMKLQGELQLQHTRVVICCNFQPFPTPFIITNSQKKLLKISSYKACKNEKSKLNQSRWQSRNQSLKWWQWWHLATREWRCDKRQQMVCSMASTGKEQSPPTTTNVDCGSCGWQMAYFALLIPSDKFKFYPF